VCALHHGVGFYSDDGSMNRTDIADYVAANLQDR